MIRPLTAADADACDAIIASLPYHFGDAGGRAECAQAVRTQDGLAAVADGAVAGFLTWVPRFGHAREITWLAVHAERRRGGIGGRLVQQLAESARAAGCSYLLVTTLAESSAEPGVTDGYEGTRRFYRSHGFVHLWEPEGWWNDQNQAVLMLRDLSR